MPKNLQMQDCNGRRFGALVTMMPLLILAIVMLGAPFASALNPFQAFHHTAFAPSFSGSPTDVSLVPFHGSSLNYHTDSTPPLRLHYGDNGNTHNSNTVSFVGKTESQTNNKESRNTNYKYNNDHKYTYNYNYQGLDVHDKSFINGIKITDVDRSNPHLLKVTLERTHNGNIPKYISVVAVSKNDQTVAGSTTLKGDDINNSLTVNVILKNKNNKNGHLDASSDVTVWVVPATISD